MQPGGLRAAPSHPQNFGSKLVRKEPDGVKSTFRTRREPSSLLWDSVSLPVKRMAHSGTPFLAGTGVTLFAVGYLFRKSD